MNEDLDKIEEDLKESASRRNEEKKTQKKSGRSVFKLQEIIKDKAERQDNQDNLDNRDDQENRQ